MSLIASIPKSFLHSSQEPFDDPGATPMPSTDDLDMTLVPQSTPVKQEPAAVVLTPPRKGPKEKTSKKSVKKKRKSPKDHEDWEDVSNR